MMWWIAATHAISGPWVVGSGQLDVFVGAEAQRLDRLQIQRGLDGSGTETIDVDQGISTAGVKAIATLGVTSRMDIEVDVPWTRAQANRTDGPVCAALGPGSCVTTQGIGVISAKAKYLIFDQVAGAPFSFSAKLEGRVGLTTHRTRRRLTNLGEGTLDAGMILAAGYVGGVGQGYWSAHLDAGFRYRFPNTRIYGDPDGSQRAPQEELVGEFETFLFPTTRFGFGPSITSLGRPGGLDWRDLDLGDDDRLSALRVANIRVGGTLVCRASPSLAASLSVLNTVYAVNNPYVTTVTLGISFQQRVIKDL